MPRAAVGRPRHNRCCHLQHPRFAAGAVDQAVGLFVAGELQSLGVPFERSLQLVSDEPQVGHGHRVDGELDVAERPLPRLDAFEEIAVDAAGALVVRFTSFRR